MQRHSIQSITLGLATLTQLALAACVDEPYEDELALCAEFPEECDDVERAATVDPKMSVVPGEYKHYTFNKIANYRYTICINVPTGDADLYGHYTGYPTYNNYQFASVNGDDEDDDCISFDATSNGPYYISVYGFDGEGSEYVYRMTSSPKTSAPAYLSESLNWPVNTCTSVTSSKYGPFNSPWGNAIGDANPFFPEHQNWLHSGTDIACPPSTTVRAACAGPVKGLGNLGSDILNGVTYYWGYYVLQECTLNGSTVTIVYDHLKSAGRPALNANLAVDAVVGTIYDISYPGEVDHLHFGICKGNYATCYTNAMYKANAGAMPDTAFSGLLIDPHNAAIYNDVVSF